MSAYLTRLAVAQRKLNIAQRTRDRALIDAYRAGGALGDLAAASGVPISTVRRHLIAAGVELRVPGRHDGRPPRRAQEPCRACGHPLADHGSLGCQVQTDDGVCRCRRGGTT